MKIIFITVAMIAMVATEPPPSKSYLPPPSGRSPGYPRGPQSSINAVPEVVSARGLEGHGQEVNGNGFTRSSLQDQSHARFGHDGDLSRDQNPGSLGRNVDGDDDSVSFEADVSAFNAHAHAEGRSGYDTNAGSIGNHDNGVVTARVKNGARSNGY